MGAHCTDLGKFGHCVLTAGRFCQSLKKGHILKLPFEILKYGAFFHNFWTLKEET